MGTRRSSLTRPPKRQSLGQAVRREAGYAGSTKRLSAQAFLELRRLRWSAVADAGLRRLPPLSTSHGRASVETFAGGLARPLWFRSSLLVFVANDSRLRLGDCCEVG